MQFLKSIKWKRLFKTEDSRFILATGLKVTGISFGIFLALCYMGWIIIYMNNLFFESYGYPQISQLQEAFFERILSNFFDWLPVLLAFFIGLFFTGMYIGKLLLRPFEAIGEYCEAVIEDKNIQYNPETFSDFRLLTRFGDLFFTHIAKCREEGAFTSIEILPQFSKIHKPVFDKVFFFHFMLFTFVISVISSLVLLILSVEIHQNIVELAINILGKNQKMVNHFLKGQSQILDPFLTYSLILLFLSYMMLAVHLYNKVSGAAFGFFSTMRSFLKGGYHSRVHLIGYKHIRPQSLAFNKYLDYLQKNYINNKNKT
jgi:hypothetical protein